MALARGIADTAHLGRENIAVPGHAHQRCSQTLFALATPIERSSVEKVDAQIKGILHDLVDLLRLNVAVHAAEGRSAQANAGNAQPGTSQGPFLQWIHRGSILLCRILR